MANDREFIIQPLITEGKVVKGSDIDFNTTYAQIGVWQSNQQQAGSPGNSFPSYAIALSELAGSPNFKNYLVVDQLYGNDATAQAYNFNLPYSTIDAAIAAAQPRDLIIVNPGPFGYGVNVNVLSKNLSFYLYDKTFVYFSSATSSNPGISLNIYGKGDIIFASGIIAEDYFDGSIDIECNNITFNDITFLTPYSYANPENRTFRIRAKNFTQNGQAGILYSFPWILDIDVENYYSSVYGPGSYGLANFWLGYNSGINNQPASRIKIKYANVFCPLNGYPQDSPSFVNIAAGSPDYNFFLDIESLLINNTIAGSNIGAPFLFRVGPTSGNFFINVKQGYLNNYTILYDQAYPDAHALIEGKYYINNSASEAIFTPLAVQAMTVESRADIIALIYKTNSILNVSNQGKVDLIGGKLINQDGVNGIGIQKSSGSSISVLRLKDVKIIAPSSFIGALPGEALEIYSAYTNSNPVNYANTLAPSTTWVVNALMSDNNF